MIELVTSRPVAVAKVIAPLPDEVFHRLFEEVPAGISDADWLRLGELDLTARALAVKNWSGIAHNNVLANLVEMSSEHRERWVAMMEGKEIFHPIVFLRMPPIAREIYIDQRQQGLHPICANFAAIAFIAWIYVAQTFLSVRVGEKRFRKNGDQTCRFGASSFA